jgi:hypothetical protein
MVLTLISLALGTAALGVLQVVKKAGGIRRVCTCGARLYSLVIADLKGPRYTYDYAALADRPSRCRSRNWAASRRPR